MSINATFDSLKKASNNYIWFSERQQSFIGPISCIFFLCAVYQKYQFSQYLKYKMCFSEGGAVLIPNRFPFRLVLYLWVWQCGCGKKGRLLKNAERHFLISSGKIWNIFCIFLFDFRNGEPFKNIVRKFEMNRSKTKKDTDLTNHISYMAARTHGSNDKKLQPLVFFPRKPSSLSMKALERWVGVFTQNNNEKSNQLIWKI